jgi:6-phosphogluconate dehydrogenase (decarboxylating)
MQVGFIGLGRMGAPMAASIEAAGHSVVGMTCLRRGGSKVFPALSLPMGLAQVAAEKERRVNVLARQPAHSHARKTI